MLISQASNGQILNGSIQIFFLLANTWTINLLLQARGYCFLAFAALTCTLLTWDYFRRGSSLSFVGLPLMVWLGSWTAPTFAFFGGGLLVTLLVYTRDWRWIPAGVCALLAILLVYWPVRAALLLIDTTYTKFWGKKFGNWEAINDTLSLYFLFGTASWSTLLVSILLVVGVIRTQPDQPENKASLCLAIAVLVTFVLCLKMGTVAEDVVTRGERVQQTIDIVHQHGGQVVGLGMIVDRSGGRHPNFGCPFVSLVAMNVETFAAGNLPADLRAISAVKPGSR